jgi:hypothetical protein
MGYEDLETVYSYITMNKSLAKPMQMVMLYR